MRKRIIPLLLTACLAMQLLAGAAAMAASPNLAPITIAALNPETEGRVVMTTLTGAAIADPGAIEEGTYVKLRAEAADGMRFVEWRRLSELPLSDSLVSGSFEEIGVGETSVDNPMTVQAMSPAIYQAVFEQIEKNPEDGLRLESIRILAPEQRQLIQEDGSKEFDPCSLRHHVYFSEDEAADLSLRITALSSGAAVTVSGEALVMDPGKRVGTAELRGLADGMEIPVSVSLGDQTTTYTIQVHVVAAPQIVAELDAPAGSPYADLAVVVKHTQFLAIDVKLKLTGGYMTFTDTNYDPLGSGELKDDADNYFGLHQGVTLVSMERGADATELSLSFQTADDKTPLVIGEEGMTVIRLYLKKTSLAGDMSADNLVKNGIGVREEEDKAEAKMTDVRFSELKLKDHPLLLAKEAARMCEMGGFVNADASYSRVRYTVKDKLKAPDKQTRVENQELTEQYLMKTSGPKSDYEIEIRADGYLPLKLQLSNVLKNTYLDAMTLLAGDVSGDGIIDVDDRDQLLKVLGQKPAKPGEAVTDPGDPKKEIYGDFNDDGVIDALDLGNLLSNYANSRQ